MLGSQQGQRPSPALICRLQNPLRPLILERFGGVNTPKGAGLLCRQYPDDGTAQALFSGFYAGKAAAATLKGAPVFICLLYTSPSPRDS